MSKFQIINDTNNQFHDRKCCAALEYCNFDFGYVICLCNEERSLFHYFIANIIVLSGYSIVMYYGLNEYECNVTWR